jgi:hypothetical protein
LQKLAWAAGHDVKPPEYVFAAAATEKPAVEAASCSESHSKSCCAQEKQCCGQEAEQALDVAERNRTQASAAPGWSIGFVSAIEARLCHGQAELWLALGAALPPPAPIELNLEAVASGSVVITFPSFVSVELSPDSPPPRV